MEKKYIFLYGKTIESMKLLNDLRDKKNISLKNVYKSKYKNFIYKTIRSIVLSQKINKVINIPLGYYFLDFSQYKFESDNEYYIIAFAESFQRCNYHVFKKLNRKKNVHLIAVFLDSMDAHTNMVEVQKRFIKKVDWDYIFSFDLNDCKHYGYEYLDEMYYSKHNNNLENNEEKDLYFIGRVKPGRKDEIIKIYDYLKGKGLKLDFNLVYTDNKIKKIFSKEELNNGIRYLDHFKDYDEILSEVTKSKCILEYNTTGQKSQSLRYFEAVTLNKKLLTNNFNVKELNFYDGQYMKVFNNLEDIDIDWLKDNIKVNYEYRNEFSPIRLINKIDGLYKGDKE